MNDNQTTTIEAPEVNPFAERAAALEAKPKPFFGVIYGPPGVGKSTFASEAPEPIDW